MAMIRRKNTKPEIIVRSYLFSRGFRYRINVKKLPGTPDIVLKKYKTVIFINGCFWHGHNGCRKFVLPKTNTEWWLNKIKTNQLGINNNIIYSKIWIGMLLLSGNAHCIRIISEVHWKTSKCKSKKAQNKYLHLPVFNYKVICCENLRSSRVGGICILIP